MSETEAPETPQPPDIERRTLTPFGYAVCVAVPILIAALGFTFLHFHYDKEDLVDGDSIRILTSQWQPGDPADGALATGALVLGDDGCLRLGAADGTQLELVWPADYEATVQRVGRDDQLKVYDPDRNIVARSKPGHRARRRLHRRGGVRRPGLRPERRGRSSWCSPSPGSSTRPRPDRLRHGPRRGHRP